MYVCLWSSSETDPAFGDQVAAYIERRKVKAAAHRGKRTFIHYQEEMAYVEQKLDLGMVGWCIEPLGG
jgi:hypothetical protein